MLSVDRTGSTNALAAELARSGAPDGSVVVAQSQAGGRGRWNRSWASPEGGLYLSVVLRPSEPFRPALLPLTAAVAVAEALAESPGVVPRLRWPNDIFASGKKLGGVLCESSFQGDRLDFAVVGIGVNVDPRIEELPAELRDRVTSLGELTGRAFDPLESAAGILLALEARLFGASGALDRFRELADGLSGAPVRVVSPGGESLEATSAGLAGDGGLCVRLADGASRTLYSEDVLLLRPADEPVR